MKQFVVILTIGILSCGPPGTVKENSAESKKTVDKKTTSLPNVGIEIQGDFDGDGMTEIAMREKIKEGKGNPVESGVPDEYEIRFSNDKIGSINVGCCDIRLINEGDLDNDGKEEISIFQAPMNGCTYSMTTYSLKHTTWKHTVETFLIPTNCEEIDDNELQKRVFRENDSIYYLDTDLNDESGQLKKRKVTTN